MSLKYNKALIGFVLLTLLACSEQKEEQAPVIEIIKAVKTQTVTMAVDSNERVLAGTTISGDEQSLSFRVSGVIVELPIKVGDVLKQGDTVAKLDTTDYDISVRQAQASVAQAKATEISAKSNYERVKDLYSAQAASLSDLESARANASSAKASVAVTQQQLNSALKKKQYTTLSSGANQCQVVSVLTTINSTINAGDAVVKFSCGSHLRVKMVVPEALIDQIKMGDSVIVSIPSVGEDKFAGRVVEVAVSNTDAAGFDVEIELLDDIEDLRVGVTTSVTLALVADSVQKHAILPAHAVIKDGQGNYVFVLSKEQIDGIYTAQRKPVEAGQISNQGLEVLSGLDEGDQVIISGVSKVSEKMKVKRINEG